jgi:hypothetical protein
MRRAGAQPHPEESVEARVHAAYTRGVTDGEATAAQRAGELAAPVLANFGSLVKELSAARKHAREEAEDSMVKLSLAIARRICTANWPPTRGHPPAWSARHRPPQRPRNAQAPPPRRRAHRARQSCRPRHPASRRDLPRHRPRPGSAIFETTRGELDCPFTPNSKKSSEASRIVVKGRS